MLFAKEVFSCDCCMQHAKLAAHVKSRSLLFIKSFSLYRPMSSPFHYYLFNALCRPSWELFGKKYPEDRCIVCLLVSSDIQKPDLVKCFPLDLGSSTIARSVLCVAAAEDWISTVLDQKMKLFDVTQRKIRIMEFLKCFASKISCIQVLAMINQLIGILKIT